MSIEKIRVSIGSASVLGLSFNTFKVPPTKEEIYNLLVNFVN